MTIEEQFAHQLEVRREPAAEPDRRKPCIDVREIPRSPEDREIGLGHPRTPRRRPRPRSVDRLHVAAEPGDDVVAPMAGLVMRGATVPDEQGLRLKLVADGRAAYDQR